MSRIHHRDTSLLVLKIMEPGPNSLSLRKNTFNVIIQSSRYFFLSDGFSRSLFCSWLSAFAFITKWKWSFELYNLLWGKSCQDIMTHRGKEHYCKCERGHICSPVSPRTEWLCWQFFKRSKPAKAKCKAKHFHMNKSSYWWSVSWI